MGLPKRLKIGRELSNPGEPGQSLMHLPIIVVEHGDVLIFETALEAQRVLEPIDVRNDEYVAHDGHGNQLRLGVVRDRRPGFPG